MKRKERTLSVERARGSRGQDTAQTRGQQAAREGSDEKNDVKEIMGSSRERIMNALERALDMIETGRHQIEVQDTVSIWSEERVMT